LKSELKKKNHFKILKQNNNVNPIKLGWRSVVKNHKKSSIKILSLPTNRQKKEIKTNMITDFLEPNARNISNPKIKDSSISLKW
jgi:hypothetical protein